MFIVTACMCRCLLTLLFCHCISEFLYFPHVLRTGTCTSGVGPIAPVHIRTHRVGSTATVTVVGTVGLETRVAPPPTRSTAVFPAVSFTHTPPKTAARPRSTP